MKFFIDSANLGDLESLLPLGVDGVTTNPSLMSKEGFSFDASVLSEHSNMISAGTHKNLGSSVSVIDVRECSCKENIIKYASHVLSICRLFNDDQPVSIEVLSITHKAMVNEGENISRISRNNVVVKLPITYDGLVACRELSAKGIRVNMTLCFSVSQAICAARAGAAFVSPFVGRLDDIGLDGMSLISDIRSVYDNYSEFSGNNSVLGLPPKIIVASVRSVAHVVEAAKRGADSITIPPKLMHQLYSHPLTDVGLQRFLSDWKK